MSEEELRRVAGQVARDAVAAVAPDELVFFEPVRAEFFRDPDLVVEGRRQRDEVLGYGMDELVQLVTPAALAIAAAVVGAAVNRTAAIVDQAVGSGKRLLRRLLGRGKAAPAPASALPEPGAPLPRPEVTLADLDALRARVAAEARHRKLPDELIEPFTDAFVASLITHWGRPAGAAEGWGAGAAEAPVAGV